MSRENCWEFFRCGRQPGGNKSQKLGVCPAALDAEADGINNGRNGGRICWAIAGTFCEGEPEGIHLQNNRTCTDCQFYKKVKAEEGFLEYRIVKPGQFK